MGAVVRTTEQPTQAPLPDIVEKLGCAIAGAQSACGRGSAELGKTMAATEVEIGGETHNRLSPRFVPSFHAFAEVTVEAKPSDTMSEGTTFGGGVEVSGSRGAPFLMAGATVSAGGERRFSVSAGGASSIAAGLVSLPPPKRFLEVLRAATPVRP